MARCCFHQPLNGHKADEATQFIYIAESSLYIHASAILVTYVRVL